MIKIKAYSENCRKNGDCSRIAGCEENAIDSK